MLITKFKDVFTNQIFRMFWFYLLSFISLLILGISYIPTNEVTQVIEYLVYLSPRWGILFLLLPVFLFWKKLKVLNQVLFIVYSFIFIIFQDINVNFSSIEPSKSSIKILSLNMGEGSASKYIKTIIKRDNPDIFLFQESKVDHLKSNFLPPWQFQCDAGLCIASKFPFVKKGDFSRRMFQGWGNFAAYYEVNIEGKVLPVMNLHLETPRSILSDLLNRSITLSKVKTFHENKSLEAQLITTWADSQPRFVMAGDFNMTSNERLYKDYFSSYKNVINEEGVGVNYTKYTSWHGVRIDHILTSNNIVIEQAKVMPSLGGDHRAIVTKVNLL